MNISSIIIQLRENKEFSFENPEKLTMIKLVGHISPLNQTLLNKIIAEMIQSFLKATLEFNEELLEGFMYPRGIYSLLHKYNHENPDKSEAHGFKVHDLGHAQILDIINIRRVILKIQHALLNVEDRDFALVIQNLCKKLEFLVYELLRNLSIYIEVPRCSKLYKVILTEQLPNFQEFFPAYKQLNLITNALLETAMKTGQDSSKYFEMDISLSEAVTKFIKSNDKWLLNMLMNSNGFCEYQSSQISVNPESPLSPIKMVRSASFKKFNQERKNRLRLFHRSL